MEITIKIQITLEVPKEFEQNPENFKGLAMKSIIHRMYTRWDAVRNVIKLKDSD